MELTTTIENFRTHKAKGTNTEIRARKGLVRKWDDEQGKKVLDEITRLLMRSGLDPDYFKYLTIDKLGRDLVNGVTEVGHGAIFVGVISYVMDDEANRDETMFESEDYVVAFQRCRSLGNLTDQEFEALADQVQVLLDTMPSKWKLQRHYY